MPLLIDVLSQVSLYTFLDHEGDPRMSFPGHSPEESLKMLVVFISFIGPQPQPCMPLNLVIVVGAYNIEGSGYLSSAVFFFCTSDSTVIV